ncbi:MAG: hypothetical protein ACE5R6_15795 [Candidatus Heimdallarchaeota archaeon]
MSDQISKFGEAASGTESPSARVRRVSYTRAEIEETFVEGELDSHPYLIFEKQINDLNQRLDTITNQVAELQRMIEEESPVRIRVVEVRDVTVSEAEKLILEYLETHKVAYPDDIADELGLDLEITMEAVRKLKKEKKIKD